MTEEWRQISAFCGVDVRRLYVDGEPTDLFMLNGRLGYLTAEWREKAKTLASETKQLFIEGIPTLIHSFDGRAMPEIRGGATVDKQVGATANDGVRWGTTDFTTTNQNNQIGKLAGKLYHLFALWTGCTWEGTIGSNSYIECYANINGLGSPLMAVYFVDEDSPAAPTTYSEFDADPLTTSYVDWDAAWTADTWEQSPSLQNPLQEITDSYTISNDNVMAQIKDDGSANNTYNAARDYSNLSGSEYAAKLHVEYSAAVGQPTAVRTWGVPSGAGYNSGAGKWN